MFLQNLARLFRVWRKKVFLSAIDRYSSKGLSFKKSARSGMLMVWKEAFK